MRAIENSVRKLVAGCVFACCLTSFTLQTFAIDGLKVTVQGTDVALSWPSIPGQTFLILYTTNLNDPIQWTILATGYQAASGTNNTTYIDSGRIQLVPSGDVSIVAMSVQNGTMVANQPSEPLVKPADGSGAAVPLMLYPPGFDLSDFLILDPATAQWASGAGYSVAAAPVAASTDGITPSGGPVLPDGGSGGGAGSTTAPVCGFYEVMGVTVTGGITNGSVSDYIQSITAKPEIDLKYLQLLVDGQPYPAQDALTPPFTNAIEFDWVDTTLLTNGPHTIQVEAVYQIQNPVSDGLNHVLSQPFQVSAFNELSFPAWDDMTEDLVCNFDIVSAHPIVNWEIDIYNIFHSHPTTRGMRG